MEAPFLGTEICTRTAHAVGAVVLPDGPAAAAAAAVLEERPLADPARRVERPLLEDDLALLPVKVLALLNLNFGVLCVMMKAVNVTIGYSDSRFKVTL